MRAVLQPLLCVFMQCHRKAHSAALAGICYSDALGTHVPLLYCQEEAQNAIDPIGIAVKRFRTLVYTCQIWEEAFSPTQKGTALEEVALYCMSMCWYIQICFQLNRCGAALDDLSPHVGCVLFKKIGAADKGWGTGKLIILLLM